MSDLVKEKDDALTEKLEDQKQNAELAQKIALQERDVTVRVTITRETKIVKTPGKAKPGSNMANAMAALGSEKKEDEKAVAENDKATEQDAAAKADKSEAEKALLAQNQKKAPQPIGKAKVTAAMLRINRSPKDDPVYLGTLRDTDVVNYYGEKDGYLEVHVGNQVGYIAAKYTDKGDRKVAESKTDAKAVDQAPEELQKLLAHDVLTAEQVADARKMIEQCPENIRGDLYEALQLKAGKAVAENELPADAAEYTNLASCMTMLGVSNPTPEQSMTSYLMQLKREQKLPDGAGMQNWGSLANAMGVSYQSLCAAGDQKSAEKTFWMKNVREQLRSGQAVMASVNNQAVRIEAVEEDGLVMTLPENGTQVASVSGFETYNGKAEQKSSGQRGMMKFDALKDNMDWVISLG
ncbi:MAG: hypothetical protein IKY83_14360 [Proteobacteria bacterium]|nr:hypothetical protein [Pseudomonadota bacterium]